MDNKRQQIARKTGLVKRLIIELDASQAERLDNISKSIGMTKKDIVAQALNMWFSLSGQ